LNHHEFLLFSIRPLSFELSRISFSYILPLAFLCVLSLGSSKNYRFMYSEKPAGNRTPKAPGKKRIDFIVPYIENSSTSRHIDSHW